MKLLTVGDLFVTQWLDDSMQTRRRLIDAVPMLPDMIRAGLDMMQIDNRLGIQVYPREREKVEAALLLLGITPGGLYPKWVWVVNSRVVAEFYCGHLYIVTHELAAALEPTCD